MGAANVGQMFTKDIYFGDGLLLPVTGMMRRVPQVVIKVLRIEEYLDEVKARIDTFLLHHPYLQRKEVPAEMVTASGLGLDPITPQCAYVQVKE